MLKYFNDFINWYLNPKKIYNPWRRRYIIFCIGFLDICFLSYLYYRYLFNKLTPEQQKQVELEQKTPMTHREIKQSLNWKVSYKALGLFFVWLLPLRAILFMYLTFSLLVFNDDTIYLKQPEQKACTLVSFAFVFIPIHLPYCYGVPKIRKAFQPNFLEEERVREARRNCYFSLMRDAGECSVYLSQLSRRGDHDKAQRFLDRWDPTRLKNKDHAEYCISNMRISFYYRSIDDLDKAKKYEDIFEECREEAGL